jgi:hypothetical protein
METTTFYFNTRRETAAMFVITSSNLVVFIPTSMLF